MSAISLDDQTVHYEVLGRGAALIFVHGWLGSWRYWVPAMQTLSSRCRTYALDLWGFGDSSRRPERYSLEAQSALLRGFMDELGIGQAAIVGHSFGGALALRLAAEQPERVTRLMAVSVPLVGAAVNPRLSGTAAAVLIEWLLGRGPVADQVGVEAGKADIAALDACVRAVMSPDVRADLGRVRAPCLLVHGERDPAVAAPQEAWLENANASPVHRISFEELRHFPMLEDATKFNRLLLDFLEVGDDLTKLQLKEEWKRRMR